MVLPGMAARQISVDIIGVPPATTRIRQAEPEPQDSIEIASEIEPGLDDIGAEDDRLARRCRELPAVRKLHRQDQQRIPGALGLDVITALFHDQASLLGWNERGRQGSRVEQNGRIPTFYVLQSSNGVVVAVGDNDFGGAEVAEIDILDLIEAKRPCRALLMQNLGD